MSGHGEQETRPEAERFWEKVDVRGPDDCWEWKAGRTEDGYGRFSGASCGRRGSHQIAYVMARGPIPEGLQVLHHCDNPPCCNPDHLFVGTNQDNVDDKMRKGRGPDYRGEKHPRARLNDDIVRRIRRMRSAGESVQRISEELEINHWSVYDVIQGRSWTHVVD